MKTSTRLRLTLGSVLFAFIAANSLATASPPAAEARRDLLDLLVQKGVLTSTEAAELASPPPAPSAAPVVLPGARHVSKLVIAGRIQSQFAVLSAEQDAAADPATVSRFILRRVYLTARADFGPDWRLRLNYNFANQLFDTATIQWGDPASFTVEAGWRPVNLSRERRTSSGSLKAIERSAATRYVIESNNGTRLGAGSYRVGLFADGKSGPLFWGAAITNPEQPTSTAAGSGPGQAGVNQPALWLNGGIDHRTASSRLIVGTGLGWLPDQGGPTPGATARDLTVGTVYADYTAGRFAFLTELLAADMPEGALGGADARVWGAFAQPSWAFTPAFEGVFRISYLDTDGRGVTLRDAVPLAPLTPATDRLWETYLGLNWYLRGDDLKLQTGLIYARGEDTPAGAPARVETLGLRSQLQVNF